MVNISGQSDIHHSGHGDLFKVLITTSSIILFSLEEVINRIITVRVIAPKKKMKIILIIS